MKREMRRPFTLAVWVLSVGLVVLWAGPGWGRLEERANRPAVEMRRPGPTLAPVASSALLFQKNVIREIAPSLNQSERRKLNEMADRLEAALAKLNGELEKLGQANAQLADVNASLETSSSQLEGKLTTARTELFGSLGAFVLAVLEITRRYFATKQLRLQVQKLQTQVDGR